VAPLAARAGTCTTGATANQAALTKPAQHYCDVPAVSVANVCAGIVPTGYDACITIGNQTAACPSPFTRQFRVQDGATVTCATCTQCSLTATCSNQALTLFSQAGCAGNIGTITANNTCQGTNAEEVAVNSIQYTATMSPPLCAAGTSAPTTTVTGPRTICCR